MTRWNFNPDPKTQEKLNWCLQRIKSVPYDVSFRWLFYRMVQEKGYPKSTNANKLLMMQTADARRCFWNGWAPNTLKDDTRKAIYGGYGYDDAAQWIANFKYKRCVLDKLASQGKLVEVWFEAEAMHNQFEFHTEPYRVTLRPFKGDPSLDFKWKIAEDLAELQTTYHKPIVILYFGDYDPKGLMIPEVAVDHIRRWCKTKFSFIRCGLNLDQIEKFSIPDQPDKPGCYQWEALNEEQARELIITNLEKYRDLKKIRAIQEQENRISLQWQQKINEVLETWEDPE